jgi:hypothetical protein
MAKYEPQCVDPAVGELLVDHARKQLGPAERARFDAHLECCLACSEQLRPMRRLLQAIDSLGPTEADLLGDPGPKRPSLFGGATALIAVAVAVALLIVGLTWQRARDVAVVREMRDLEARLVRLEQKGDEILRAVDGTSSPTGAAPVGHFVTLPNL